MTSYSLTLSDLDELPIDVAYAMYLGVGELERQRTKEQLAIVTTAVWGKPEQRRRMDKALD